MTEPISLLDLRRKTKIIELGSGQSIKIEGLTARQICDHLDKYPVLRVMSIEGTMSMTEAIAGVPGALAAWVASACGMHGNPEAEEAATNEMTIEDASEIVGQSMALTFSRGFGPFSARLAVLLGYITVGRTTVPAPRSPRSSSHAASPPTTDHGTSPPDNSQLSSTSTSEDASAPMPT